MMPLMKKYPSHRVSDAEFANRWKLLLNLRQKYPELSFERLSDKYFSATRPRHRLSRQRVHQIVKRAGL